MELPTNSEAMTELMATEDDAVSKVDNSPLHQFAADVALPVNEAVVAVRSMDSDPGVTSGMADTVGEALGDSIANGSDLLEIAGKGVEIVGGIGLGALKAIGKVGEFFSS